MPMLHLHGASYGCYDWYEVPQAWLYLHDVVPVGVDRLVAGQGGVVEVLPAEPSLPLSSYQDLGQTAHNPGVQAVHLISQHRVRQGFCRLSSEATF